MKLKKKPASGPRRRPGKNTFTTKSGTDIKVNRSLTERIKANRDARARRRAAYLSTLPKNRFKRILYRLRPKELVRFWFSRDGAITALKITGAGIVAVFVLVVGVFAYFRKDLPNITDLSGKTLGGSVTYTDRTDKVVLFQDYNDTKRLQVPGSKMSQYVRKATVAVEDKDFYRHGAFDVRGIMRAGINNLLNKGGGIQGGSTISQQLVKLDQKWAAQRTVGNKIKEVILAVEMEREYSKDDILTGYLNAAPYGPISVGVQVAAQDYFDKDASELTIDEAAMLAAIPKAPSSYSPYGPLYEPTALIARQRYIIGQMAAQHLISKEEATTAKEVDILAKVKPQKPSLYTGIKAPYFVLAAKDELKNKYGAKTVQRGGWRVTTTLDIKLQQLAEKKIKETLPIIKLQLGDTAAFAAIDNETGQMVSLVGGVDFSDKDHGSLNFGHTVKVSPGSTFKPYDYATFIENNNAGAGSVLYDSYTNLPYYPCNAKRGAAGGCLRDYDYRSRKPPGPLTLRYALAGSRNITAVKAMLSAVPNDTSPDRIASVNKTIATADAMMGGGGDKYLCFQQGTDVFRTSTDISYQKERKQQCYASSAIGDGAYLTLDNHVTGLSTFARMGKQLPHTYILRITDASNKIIDEYKKPKGKQVIKDETAFIMNDMLSDPNASYLGRKFQNYKGWKFAVKTGTTNDSFDGLMGSWSTKYTALTWVGYHNRNRELKGFMENMTTPIIRGWMEGAHDRLGGKPVNWQRPKGIQVLPAYVITTHVGVSSREPSPSKDLFPSWYKAPKVGNSSKVIDVVSNKTATECTPDLAKKTQKGGGHNAFSVDVFSGLPSSASSSSSDATDDVHNCNDDTPLVALDASGCVLITSCEFTVDVTQGEYALSGGSYTTSPAGTLSILVNGNVIEAVPIPEDAGNPWTYTFQYDPPLGTDSFTIETRAVDSVLYSGTDSATVDFPGP